MWEFLSPELVDAISKLGFPAVGFLLLWFSFVKFAERWMVGNEQRAERITNATVLISERQSVMDGKLDKSLQVFSDKHDDLHGLMSQIAQSAYESKAASETSAKKSEEAMYLMQRLYTLVENKEK